MNNFFTYSILQYKHSLVLGEALNVGVLFYFPNKRKLEFVSVSGTRAKSIYPDFDHAIFNSLIRIISSKITTRVSLFADESIDVNIKDYINKNIFSQDAAGLVFKEPSTVQNFYNSNEDAVKDYSQLLLPGILLDKPISTVRHNEKFILSKYTNIIFDKDKEFEKKFKRNELVSTNKIDLKFELSLQNKVQKRYIKPISFDLLHPQAIQEKAVTFLGYLIQLNDYAKAKQARFDFLISKPQNNALIKDYNNALDILSTAKTPKELVTEDKLVDYSKETISEFYEIY